MSLSKKFQTIDFSDIDFFNAGDLDDVTLSQVCEQMENQNDVFNGLDGLSLTQTVCQYDIEESDESQMEEENYGNFNIEYNLETDVQQPTEPTPGPNDLAHDTNDQRFADPVSEEDILRLLENHENANTKKNTAWAVGVFDSWRQSRNRSETGFVPEIVDMQSCELNYFMGRFVVEARKRDKTPYPPKSLYLICAGLLRHLRENGVYDKNFLDPKNLLFCEFRKILDSRMKERLSQGHGCSTKKADPILPEDEAAIWEAGVFGNASSEALQCTIFFYSCKLFGLRGHDEHHALECDQFTVGEDGNGKFILFNGRNTKTYKGGLKEMTLGNKQIKHYCKEGERCIADFFGTYLEALGNSGKFYRLPLAGRPIRYGNQVVGVNKLKNMMKVICNRAGLKGNYSNHSGKRTCATQLYIAGVDEQEIMKRTGHRSEKGVRKSCPEIDLKVASVLDPPRPKVSKVTVLDKQEVFDNPKQQSSVICKREEAEFETGNEFDRNDPRLALHDIGNSPYFANCQVSINYK